MHYRWLGFFNEFDIISPLELCGWKWRYSRTHSGLLAAAATLPFTLAVLAALATLFAVLALAVLAAGALGAFFAALAALTLGSTGTLSAFLTLAVFATLALRAFFASFATLAFVAASTFALGFCSFAATTVANLLDGIDLAHVKGKGGAHLDGNGKNQREDEHELLHRKTSIKASGHIRIPNWIAPSMGPNWYLNTASNNCRGSLRHTWDNGTSVNPQNRRTALSALGRVRHASTTYAPPPASGPAAGW